MPNAKKITAFDFLIISAHTFFLLPFDWRLLKAQLIAESALNPQATSAVGAMGLAQFMPDTWAEMLDKVNMPADTSPFNAEASIHCCGFYMESLIKQWSSPRPEIDRYCLALASYNAGLGNILKAQKLAKSDRYHEIIAQLPKVTGDDNAKQTSDYVSRIMATWSKMVLQG
jgi:membrane-bound lytic murein transglycosylase MltF